MYAIVDVETTGLSPKYEKLIDIALVIHNGKQVVDEFYTLINPEKSIPAHITRLTGITNGMVREAPKFWEIARDIVLMTEGKTFVAHNVNFDYRFVQSEFAELGYDFKMKKLCTLKLSRKLLPGKKSYSLGNLCRELGFGVDNRHRAYGDARATAILFQHLMSFENGAKSKIRSPISDMSILQNLPEETGVYYFLNHQHEVIYIGKSKNIKSRVLSHFQESPSRRASNMIEQIGDINYEVTGSELVALLKESHEIKEQKPLYNRRQRRSSSDFGIYHSEDTNGYIRLKIEKFSIEEGLLTTFNSHREAKEFLFGLCERHNLCQKLCGLYETEGACFYYHVSSCRGACIQEEPPESYNMRAYQAIRKYDLDHENVFIVENGRTEDEKAVIKIENGHYAGYGFIDAGMDGLNPDLLHDVIRSYPPNQDVYRILRNYLRTRKVNTIIGY
ncbi:MAG: exonuclease domain-containing protein [Bacteroidales bacterium]|nr:GIY-YIG nuclease family protein [Bacteroidales bacterium]